MINKVLSLHHHASSRALSLLHSHSRVIACGGSSRGDPWLVTCFFKGLRLDCFASLAMTRGGVFVLEALRAFFGKGIKEAGKVLRKALSCS